MKIALSVIALLLLVIALLALVVLLLVAVLFVLSVALLLLILVLVFVLVLVVAATAAVLVVVYQALGVGVVVLGLLVGSSMGNNTAWDSNRSLQQRYNAVYTQCMYAKGNQVPVPAEYAAPQQQTSPVPPDYIPDGAVPPDYQP